jgi:hypothetical protein
MNEELERRIEQVVGLFDDLSWRCLEKFPPSYVIQRKDTEGQLEIGEGILWDLREAKRDDLRDSQLYGLLKYIKNIPSEVFANLPDLL